MIYFICIAFFFAVWFVTEAKLITVRRIKLGGRGIKIAVFSDVHIGKYVSKAQLIRCIKKINGQNPDIVLCLGDIAYRHNSSGSITPRETADILNLLNTGKRYAVYGNNDYLDNSVTGFSKKVFALAGFCMLENKNTQPCTGLTLIGVSDYKLKLDNIGKAIAGCSDTDFKLLMVHEPDFFDVACNYPIDLQVSGHSHGGQCIGAKYFIKPLLPLYAKKYVRGTHRKNGSVLCISNGVGSHTLPFRFLTPPDILLIEI